MTSSEQHAICTMFDRIAATYDGLNRVLSFGRDQQWRRKVADLLPNKHGIKVLDVATGTGDLLLLMCQMRPNITEAHGVDLAGNMLAVAKEKVRALKASNKIDLKQADACALPFADGTFDAASIAFGIRNVTDRMAGLRELARVLKPEGAALILEFSLPEHWLIRQFYLAYFRHILPWIGGIVSKDREAYLYLNRTVESFSAPETFRQEILQCGFSSVETYPLTFGVAHIYQAVK